MYYESCLALRSRLANRRWADEPREHIGAGEKLLAVALSLGIASVVTVAMPFALLHLR